MATFKKYDLKVKVGTYMGKDGSEKGNYKIIGSVMQKDDESKFILLDPYFNFSLLKPSEQYGTIMVSMFESNKKHEQQTTSEE